MLHDFAQLYDDGPISAAEADELDAAAAETGGPGSAAKFLVGGRTQAVFLTTMLVNQGTPVIVNFGVELPRSGGMMVSAYVKQLVEMQLPLFIVVYLGLLVFMYFAGESALHRVS